MADKPPAQPGQKKNELMRALVDLVILALLLTGAASGGYYWGIHERLAPVTAVPAGTPGALPPPAQAMPAPVPVDVAITADATPDSNADSKPEIKPAGSKAKKAAGKSDQDRTKYWISSSGADYTGYSVTVKVNQTPVDNFFGPGKNIDITRYVKAGDNAVTFEAKALGDQYNKHPGEEGAELVLQLVSGPFLQENFGSSDVLLTYRRNAAESQDFNDTMHFKAD